MSESTAAKRLELLTELEAAEFLGVKGQTLRAWRHRNQGPPYLKLAGKIKYRSEDLSTYVEGSRVVPGSKPRRGSRGTRRGSR